MRMLWHLTVFVSLVACSEGAPPRDFDVSVDPLGPSIEVVGEPTLNRDWQSRDETTPTSPRWLVSRVGPLAFIAGRLGDYFIVGHYFAVHLFALRVDVRPDISHDQPKQPIEQ